MSFNQQNGVVILHAPGDDLDYGFQWNKVLETGETISTSIWTVTDGVTLSRASIVGTITYTFVTGGVSGKQYVLKNGITTSNGRVYNRAITIDCKRL